MKRRQKDALRFAFHYGGWQGFASDYQTRQTIHALANRGFVEIYEQGNQFRITERGRQAAQNLKGV